MKITTAITKKDYIPPYAELVSVREDCDLLVISMEIKDTIPDEDSQDDEEWIYDSSDDEE